MNPAPAASGRILRWLLRAWGVFYLTVGAAAGCIGTVRLVLSLSGEMSAFGMVFSVLEALVGIGLGLAFVPTGLALVTGNEHLLTMMWAMVGLIFLAALAVFFVFPQGAVVLLGFNLLALALPLFLANWSLEPFPTV